MNIDRFMSIVMTIVFTLLMVAAATLLIFTTFEVIIGSKLWEVIQGGNI